MSAFSEWYARWTPLDGVKNDCTYNAAASAWKAAKPVRDGRFRVGDGAAIKQVLAAKEVLCDCGHSDGCDATAAIIFRDDERFVWTLCEDCYVRCT